MSLIRWEYRRLMTRSDRQHCLLLGPPAFWWQRVSWVGVEHTDILSEIRDLVIRSQRGHSVLLDKHFIFNCTDDWTVRDVCIWTAQFYFIRFEPLHRRGSGPTG